MTWIKKFDPYSPLAHGVICSSLVVVGGGTNLEIMVELGAQAPRNIFASQEVFLALMN